MLIPCGAQRLCHRAPPVSQTDPDWMTVLIGLKVERSMGSNAAVLL